MILCVTPQIKQFRRKPQKKYLKIKKKQNEITPKWEKIHGHCTLLLDCQILVIAKDCSPSLRSFSTLRNQVTLQRRDKKQLPPRTGSSLQNVCGLTCFLSSSFPLPYPVSRTANLGIFPVQLPDSSCIELLKFFHIINICMFHLDMS